MRILHVIAQKPGQTGSGIFLQNLIRVAVTNNHDQCLVAGIAAGDSYDWLDTGMVSPFIPVIFETEALPFPVPGMSDEMPYPSTRYRQMTDEMAELWKNAFIQALEEAAAFQPDLILVHHLWLLAALTRGMFPTVPIVGICHGTELRQLISADRFSSEIIHGCRRIDRIMALSSYQKEKIKSSYGINGDKIVITGAGFNREIFYPREKRQPEGRIKALYAGKLSSAKGIPSLIRAVSQLQMPRDEFCLILAGSGCGSEYEEIQTLAGKCPFEIKFTGAVPQACLGQLMRDCHIFIMPSFYEGLSLVTMEALASGLRVVANDLPGMREWVGPSLEEQEIIEYVAMPGLRSADVPIKEDLPAYEERLRSGIFKQAIRARRFSSVPLAGCEEMVRKYSWEAVFTSIENIYQDLTLDKNY